MYRYKLLPRPEAEAESCPHRPSLPHHIVLSCPSPEPLRIHGIFHDGEVRQLHAVHDDDDHDHNDDDDHDDDGKGLKGRGVEGHHGGGGQGRHDGCGEPEQDGGVAGSGMGPLWADAIRAGNFEGQPDCGLGRLYQGGP